MYHCSTHRFEVDSAANQVDLCNERELVEFYAFKREPDIEYRGGKQTLKQLEILNFASLETLFNVTQEKYNDMSIMFVHRGPLSIKL